MSSAHRPLAWLSIAVLTIVSACGQQARPAVVSREMPQSVARELDAIREIAKSTHDEYERLYTSIVFATEEKKEAAARWYRGKELAWVNLQIDDLLVQHQGLPQSRVDMLLLLGAGDSFIEAKPTVFVETTYYPRVTEKELASVAKLKTLRQDFEAAQLRLAKAILEVEQARADSSSR